MSDLAQRVMCPRGTHDFGTGGKIRCSKCKFTMEECRVEQGHAMKTVTQRDPYAMAVPDRPGVNPIEPPSLSFRKFAQERASESRAAADAHNETINRLIASGVERAKAEKMMEFLRAGLTPEMAYVKAMESFQYIESPRGLAPVQLQSQSLAANPEPKQELLDVEPWNRADHVAGLYGLKRENGEDDDSLHTRIRAFVASNPGIFHTPPPMDWVPEKKEKRKPLSTSRRGPIIDVDPS